MFSGRKYGIYITFFAEEIYPYLIKNKKYFLLYLYYKKSGEMTFDYYDEIE